MAQAQPQVSDWFKVPCHDSLNTNAVKSTIPASPGNNDRSDLTYAACSTRG